MTNFSEDLLTLIKPTSSIDWYFEDDEDDSLEGQFYFSVLVTGGPYGEEQEEVNLIFPDAVTAKNFYDKILDGDGSYTQRIGSGETN